VFRLRSIHLLRAALLLIGLTLVAAACSSDSDDEDAAEAQADADSSDNADDDADADSSDNADDDADADSDDDADDRPAAGTTPLFVPSDTDEPFDLSGGATLATEGVTIVADSPTAALQPQVLSATEVWPTDWTRQTIDLGDLGLGIPRADPRDMIPPIDIPKFEPIAEADWLTEREPGALVQFEDEVRFYPLSILTRHEIVNDRFGNIPVIVTFCPLCNTAISFDARVDGKFARFGVSGLLRNSDLVMWDSETVSLWQQLTGEAIVGEFAGTKLDLISTAIVSYGDALESFPDALSLSQDTGFGSNYGANPYVGYSDSKSPFLFSGDPDPRFPALSRVVGLTVEDDAKAYPFGLLEEVGAVNDVVGDLPIVVWWGGETADALQGETVANGGTIGTGIAFDRRVDDQELTFSAEGDAQFTDAETSSTWNLLGQAIEGPLAGEQLTLVPHRNEFWFAWAAFFPEALVYEAG